MGFDAEKERRTAHTLSLLGRESMEVRGVVDVISFDEQAVILRTVCGTMTVEGSSLHIHVLSMEEGIVTMDGKIDAVSYEETGESDSNEKNGFFGKLFR
ncbi:MAG: sporulation protein YabP [Clostridia bacterium]|jgi:sporulation protein YabP|nr:sporulation protein YabP [Clostridia bacterium]MBQ1963082.1 sporulation protein YabP [Clostridia bacterium]MBQ5834190.1 sporulation protein YabP [Clostridia bacterium]